MSVTQGILLSHIGCGAVEVEPAAADLKTIHGSQTWRREGVHCVVGEACEEQVPVVEFMVDPSVVGVACLGFVWADREVVRQLARRAGVGCGKQFQVVQCDRIDGETCCAVARGQQRLGLLPGPMLLMSLYSARVGTVLT